MRLQLQHVAISLSLLACGATDIAISAKLPNHAARQTASTRAGAFAILEASDEEEEEEEGKEDDEEMGDAGAEGACRAACRKVCITLRTAGRWFVQWPTRPEAHTAWALNLTFAGLVFLTHPQMSLEKDGEHVALGLRSSTKNTPCAPHAGTVHHTHTHSSVLLEHA